MPDKSPLDFTEIDIDYVPQSRPEEQSGFMPHRIEKKREWFLSLFFPILSAAALVVLYICGFALPLMSALLGIGVGGVLPIALIVHGKIDTSKYFVGKLILTAAFAADFILTFYAAWYEYNIFVVIAPSIADLAAEAVYAFTRKTDGKTKTTLFLSSLGLGFFGCVLDFAPFVCEF